MSYTFLTIIPKDLSERLLKGLTISANHFDVQLLPEIYGQNTLSSFDIANADCVIVISDDKINIDRFDGKRVICVSTLEGIHRAFKVIERATTGDGEIFVKTTNETEIPAPEPKKKRKLFFKK